jgi:hypothetical protein
MITFHTHAEIPEDRRVLVVLPPETPLGRADLTVTITHSDAEAQDVAPNGGLRSLFGSVGSGDPRSGDNERIDADLARAYDNLQDWVCRCSSTRLDSFAALTPTINGTLQQRRLTIKRLCG